MTKLQEMWSYLNTHTQTTINYGMVVKLLDAVELEAVEMIDERGKEASRDADRRAEAAEAERDEARRQLAEAQMAIDVLSNTVVAQNNEIKRLSQQREDVAEYRAEITRLNQAATA